MTYVIKHNMQGLIKGAGNLDRYSNVSKEI